MGPLLTWIFNVLILFANETYGGYRYASFHPSLEVLVRHCRHSSRTDSQFHPGRIRRHLSPLAHKFQYHNAEINIIQYGLLLGL
jgi:hypothetical protein